MDAGWDVQLGFACLSGAPSRTVEWIWAGAPGPTRRASVCVLACVRASCSQAVVEVLERFLASPELTAIDRSREPSCCPMC